MFEECCSLGSPQILLEELKDDMYVSRLVEPFTKTKVENDKFQPNFVKTKLLPEIKAAIKQGRKSMFTTVPSIIRLIFDNYPELGLNVVKNDILPVVKSAIQMGGQRKVNDVSDLFVEIASSIPRDYRDDVVCEIIRKLAVDSDPKLRALAVFLIPVVREPEDIIQIFDDLKNDEVPSVRASVVSILQNCIFDEQIINEALKDAINDSCIGVQQVAANVLADIAPNMTSEYCKLLVNPNTARNAFPSMPQIVSHSSFAEIIDSFFIAMKNDKNDAAAALLETVKTVSVKSESTLYIRAAQELVSFTPFTWRLHSFSEKFERKSDFLELLNPSSISDWRTRYALLKQCQEFVPELGSSLARVAEIFSEDQVAYVRNETVNLWVSLIKNDITMKAVAVERLMRGTWHKRLILSKVIAAVGCYGFEHAIEQLKSDEVENVRYCIKESIRTCSQPLH